MKTLAKIQFIPFLKKISDTLDKEEIQHDIPFCHIDKNIFNNITIIIPDHIQSYDISKLFQCEMIKEKEGVITTIIDGFLVDFVKVRHEEWFYAFFYYSWDITHVLIDILANKTFGLRYTRTGLKYQYGDKLIPITINMKDILDFLELPFHMINNGFPTEMSMHNFIFSSQLFDSEYYNMEEFVNFDKNFNFNKLYYENFIQNKPDISGDKYSFEEQILMLDSYFHCNLLEKISKIQLKEDFPNLKEKDIVVSNIKSLEDLRNEKKDQIKNRKKIKFTKKKDDDLTFEGF